MNRRLGYLTALPTLIFLAAFLAAPLFRVVAEGGLSLGVWGQPYFLRRLGWTLSQAGLTTLIALIIGGPLAYLLSRYRLPGQGTLLRLLLLPFVTPTLVAALGLTSLFGPQGWMGLDLSETPALLILGNLLFNLPVMVRLSHAAFVRVPPNLVGAARSLGAPGWRAALGVALPLALPGVSAGMVLVFLYSALSFGLPLLLGGERYGTLEVEIYSLTAYELRLPEASALILGQLVFTVGATLLYTRLNRPAFGVETARSLPRPTGLAALALYALTGLVLMICFAPLLAVALGSVLGPGGLSLVYWRGLLSPDSNLGLLLGNTLRFAGLTLAFALLFGSLHALGAARARSARLDALSLLPLMISPISLSVGYLLLYPALRAELPLLIAAYTLLAYPLVTRSLLPALRSVPLRLLEVSRTLGASRFQTWRRVTVPLVLPALRGGAALALATVLGEFAATLVLTRPEWSTLSTGIFERLGRPGAQNLGEAQALSTLLMLLALTCFSVLDGGKGEVT